MAGNGTGNGKRRDRGAWRRVWLPAPVYAAMPWVYCALGAAALGSGLFLPDPAWRAPYLLLLAVCGLHAGIRILLLRRRFRLARRRRQRLAPAAARFPASGRDGTLAG
jgi:hypothetical protein